jgi:hypothetical protein
MTEQQPQTLPQRRQALSRAILAMLQQFEADNPDVLVSSIDIQREGSYVVRNPVVWVDVTVEVK